MLRKNLTNLVLILIGSICTIGLGSCNLDQFPNLDNTYFPNYEGNVALLLVNDTISFSEFLTDNVTDTTNYEITDNQQVIFTYDLNTNFQLGDEFVELQNFNSSKIINSPINVPFVAFTDTTLVIERQFSIDFPAVDGEDLDSIYFDGGDFKIEILSTFGKPINYSVVANSFTSLSDNSSIEIVSNLAAADRSEIQRVGLDGYKVVLFNESDSNKFYVNLRAEILVQSGEQLTGEEYLYLDIAVDEPNHDAIFGTFGTDTFNLSATRKRIKFFDDLGGTGILFEDPVIQFTIDNGFGLPAGIDLTDMRFGYTESSEKYLTGSIANTLQYMDASPVEDFGTSIRTVFQIDVNNSNIRDLLADSPNEIIIQPTGYSNLDNTSSNWLTDNSEIAINAKVSIPFSVNLSGFEFEQDTELDDLSDLEGTQELSLVINTINELPFEGHLSLYMLDENEVVLDSIVDQILFASPTSFDSNGKVSSPEANRAEVLLDQTKVNNLIQSDILRTVIKVDSYDASADNYVEVFADYDLQVKVGVRGKVSVDINGN
ncbi:hypothetical protein [Marinoscillum pacificum]|uniref:hypothetical protein n=1 Tax=Marinoscillum pacificum TaxID=392723 RepID=UPI00215828C6|nr:hypothetical protein [Marinoscillum pacificum]